MSSSSFSRCLLVLAGAGGVLLPGSPCDAAPRKPAKRLQSPPAVLRSVTVQPAGVTLDGADARQTLLVTGTRADGTLVDLTRAARYRSTKPALVAVTPQGDVRPLSDGTAAVEVRAGGRSVKVSVRVRNARREAPLTFRRDILPILTKAGCSGAACHAKQGGQAGFQMSVLAFDPEADYHAITRQGGGRRIDRSDPGHSLLLLKPAAALPHGGGQRLRVDSAEYRLIARWIAEGAPYSAPSEPEVERVVVVPAERTLQPGETQQLQVTAVYSDGTRRDVTRTAEYHSNEADIAGVEEDGLIRTTKAAGEAAVMVRYLGQVGVARITLPMNRGVPRSAYAGLPRFNFVDDLVYRKLERLNLLPSAVADDAAFLRRAYLDVIGTLPTPEETRRFLAECEAERGRVGVGRSAPRTGGERLGIRETPTPTRPHAQTPILAPKARAKLVNELLARPEYADYWAMRWVNLLLVDRDPLFPKGAFAYDRWVREAFRANLPFDRFARELVTATGETYRDGPANFYRSLATPVEQAKSVSQLFLGVRMDCAQCHHHPFERWGQDDFYALAAFFAKVRQKGSSEFERVVYVADSGEVKHPKTDKPVEPRPLGAPLPRVDSDDPRDALAAWMTAPENPYFARTIVNRMWGMLMGRGIVEPVDDFRATNPASNPELLDTLAKEFVAHGFDLKHLIRTITASAAYQRSSEATRNNARDTRNYARYYPKRMVAEVLLDAVSQATGVPETYGGHPAGTRAIQMWDNKLPVEFLAVFGRPSRLSVCECDRPADGSVTQVLHLMNSSAVQNRLTSQSGAVQALEKSGKSPDEVIEEAYLRLYSRAPRPKELEAAHAAFTRPGATRRTAIEDLFWALLNSPEFLFIR